MRTNVYTAQEMHYVLNVLHFKHIHLTGPVFMVKKSSLKLHCGVFCKQTKVLIAFIVSQQMHCEHHSVLINMLNLSPSSYISKVNCLDPTLFRSMFTSFQSSLWPFVGALMLFLAPNHHL